MNEVLGYTRVSTVDQNPDLQVDELTAAGCHRVFVEHASGARADRPKLAEVLDRLRPGDTLVVWRLDRLARSLRELIEVVATLEERGVGLRSLHEQLDTTSPGGKLSSTSSAPWPHPNRISSASEPRRDWLPPGLVVGTAAAPPS